MQLKSERFVAILGTTSVIIGMVLSAYSTSTVGIMLAYGLCVGAGIGLTYTNGILIVSKYFKKKVGIAFGMITTGLGIGALSMPQIVKLLLQSFSGKQTILIYAALCGVGYIGAMQCSIEMSPRL